MAVLMRGGVWLVAEPSKDVFEPYGLKPEALIGALDRKLSGVAKACGERRAGARFREWLGESRDDLAALVLQVPEIMCGEPLPPAMLALADYGRLSRVAASLECELPAMLPAAADFSMLDAACLACDGETPMRAFMAGELFIWVRKRSDSEILRGFTKMVQARFNDGNVVADLGLLLTLDISSRVDSGLERISPDDGEFARMAKREMERRRVDRRDDVLRGKLLRNVMERLGMEAPSRGRRPAMA